MHLGEIDHLAAISQLKSNPPDTKVAVIAHYMDDIDPLLALGADIAVYALAEAGPGFASHVVEASRRAAPHSMPGA
jgi:DNA-binding NarL/FixJ family response regulator